jgi:thiamine-phosphate diphosphorylase
MWRPRSLPVSSRIPVFCRKGEGEIGARLHLVTGNRHSSDDIVVVVEKVRLWVDQVHLRWKGRSAREIYRLGSRLLDLGLLKPTQLVVHDRLDVALALRCGVHLPEAGLPVDRVRRLVGSRCRVGVSVHSVQAAKAAAARGADYLLFGHIFPTASKPGVHPQGIHMLSRVVQAVNVPVVAIGGITPERIPEVMETGCAGVAVLSALMDSREPGQTARQMRICLDQG